MSKAQSNSKGSAPDPTIARNKRARYDYAIADTYEGGLVLTGSEVKSLRTAAGRASITEAYAVFKGDELYLLNAHIAKYDHGGYANHEERRTRKILLHRKELDKIKMALDTKGMTLVPMRLHWRRGNVKVDIGVAQGKKNIDKRQTIKERDWNRQQQKLLKKG